MAGHAFLFPGQASQAVGMGADLYKLSDTVRELFDAADEALGFSLTKVCFEGPAEELSRTAVTQPAVFVHSVAAARLLLAGGIQPECVAGHSLGEYSALVIAGALEFDEALRLVKERGRLMQDAGEKSPGKMAALIGLDDDKVTALCAEVGDAVIPANFNAPGQVVVSGEAEAVERVQELARTAGAKRVIPLQVSGAFHSRLMEPAAQALGELLEDVQLATPQVAVITNVGATPVREAEELRRLLKQQMTHPVRWTQTVECIVGMGIDSAAEVGPGSVLKGLVRRIAPDMQVTAAGTADDIPAAIETLGKHRRSQ